MKFHCRMTNVELPDDEWLVEEKRLGETNRRGAEVAEGSAEKGRRELNRQDAKGAKFSDLCGLGTLAAPTSSLSAFTSATSAPLRFVPFKSTLHSEFGNSACVIPFFFLRQPRQRSRASHRPVKMEIISQCGM